MTTDFGGGEKHEHGQVSRREGKKKTLPEGKKNGNGPKR